MNKNKIILASGSPRRIDILKKMGFDFKVIKSNYDENNNINLDPEKLAKKHAKEKALEVYSNNKIKTKDSIILGFDTFVVLNSKVIGKPKDKEDAKKILSKLSNKKHKVITGLFILDTKTKKNTITSDTSTIKFRNITKNEIQNYVNTENVLDKAGAYAVQSKAYNFIEHIEGDYYNILGLPVLKFIRTYRKFIKNIH